MSDWNTPLTFTAKENGTIINLEAVGAPIVAGLQYRTDASADFAPYTCGTEISLDNIGDIVQFQNTEEELGLSAGSYVAFSITGKAALSGNMQSMLNYSRVCKRYCYFSMFLRCVNLTSISEDLLPATTLAERCYANMFYQCTGLTSIPEALLPATTLAERCYTNMFAFCHNLKSIPSGLLPAITLAYGCYSGMFHFCTGLTSIPDGLLPATTLVDVCYASMFANCTSLAQITVNFSAWYNTATQYWLSGVAATGVFKCPEALDDTERGVDRIPEEWTVEKIKQKISVVTPVAITGSQNTAIEIVQLKAAYAQNAILTFSPFVLPDGISCSSDGIISGIPTVYGNFSALVTVSAEGAEDVNIAVNFSIAEVEVITLSKETLNIDVFENEKFSDDLKKYATTQNGNTIAFAMQNSIEGVSLENGILSGAITSAGAFHITVILSANNAEDKQITVLFSVAAPPVIAVVTPVMINAKQNAVLNDIQLKASVSNGTPPEFSAIVLPDGISCSSDGIISGTPTVYGNFSAVVTVSAEGAEDAIINIAFKIEAASNNGSGSGDNGDNESGGNQGSINITDAKKRLIGAEDIAFDTSGNSERADFMDYLGNMRPLHKINASHMPLTAKTREIIGESDVDTALFKINQKISDIVLPESGLSEDKTVTFTTSDTAADINIKIAQEKKNLNNHTMIFVFPAEVSQLLLTNIIWDDFFNGQLIIEGNNCNVYDTATLEQLFKIKKCNCQVIVRNFIFNIQYSGTAIYLEESPNVIIRNCQFNGNNNTYAYAVNGVLYNGYFSECNFTNIGRAAMSKDSFDDVTGNAQFVIVKSVISDTQLVATGEDGQEYTLQYNKTWEE